MKRPWLLLALCVGLAMAVPVGAQVALNILQLKDFTSANGTAAGYFHKVPAPYLINVKGVSYSGRTATIGTQLTNYDPDLGESQAAGQQTLLSTFRPTCTAARRGTFWMGVGDLAVKDLTYQCCRSRSGTDAGAGDATFAWIAGFCQ